MSFPYISIPFNKSSADPKGLPVGGKYEDPNTGKIYKLVKMHTTVRAAPALNDVCCTVATGDVVSDKTSALLNTTYPTVEGVVPTEGIIPVASTASAPVYQWLQVAGEVTVNTINGGDIVAGDFVVYDTGNDGKVKRQDPSVTNATLGAEAGGLVGVALAAEAASQVLVKLMLRIR